MLLGIPTACAMRAACLLHVIMREACLIRLLGVPTAYATRAAILLPVIIVCLVVVA